MHLLFDFDGTLVNSFHAVTKKIMALADDFSFKKITEEEIHGLRDLSSHEIIKFLNIPIYKIPALIFQMRKYIGLEISTLEPVRDIKVILETLHHANYTIGILTTNSVENVKKWLHYHEMTHLFSFIHSESNYFSKKKLIKKTLNKYKIEPSKAVYIGDETRDIEAAKKNQINSIAVTWGYNTKEAMLKTMPSFVAEKPEELLSFCQLLGCPM